MSFETLLAKVTRAEDALEANERQVAASARVFGTSWRQAWSPSRLIATGLATGFLAGWVRPTRAVAGVEPVRWLQLLGSVAGLAGSVQAAFAAASAQEAVDGAEEVASTSVPPAASVASAPPSARRYAPDPSWDAPPRPAEAATELSEPR